MSASISIATTNILDFHDPSTRRTDDEPSSGWLSLGARQLRIRSICLLDCGVGTVKSIGYLAAVAIASLAQILTCGRWQQAITARKSYSLRLTKTINDISLAARKIFSPYAVLQLKAEHASLSLKADQANTLEQPLPAEQSVVLAAPCPAKKTCGNEENIPPCDVPPSSSSDHASCLSGSSLPDSSEAADTDFYSSEFNFFNGYLPTYATDIVRDQTIERLDRRRLSLLECVTRVVETLAKTRFSAEWLAKSASKPLDRQVLERGIRSLRAELWEGLENGVADVLAQVDDPLHTDDPRFRTAAREYSAFREGLIDRLQDYLDQRLHLLAEEARASAIESATEELLSDAFRDLTDAIQQQLHSIIEEDRESGNPADLHALRNESYHYQRWLAEQLRSLKRTFESAENKESALQRLRFERDWFVSRQLAKVPSFGRQTMTVMNLINLTKDGYHFFPELYQYTIASRIDALRRRLGQNEPPAVEEEKLLAILDEHSVNTMLEQIFPKTLELLQTAELSPHTIQAPFSSSLSSDSSKSAIHHIFS